MPKFTDRLISSLKLEPGKKDKLLFDADCPGLGLRITAKGTRSFLVQWTDPSTKRKVREALGVWGSITIEQARTAARARLGDVARGIDPGAERRKKKEAAESERVETALTLAVLLEQWGRLHLMQRRPRYASEAVRALRYAFPSQLTRPASRLTRVTVIDALDQLVEQGKSAIASRTAAYGRACFSWAEKRGKVKHNPFAQLPVSGGTESRDRVLSDAEMAEIWAAAEALPYPFGPFYQIALLTMQRREEVAGMRWSELSQDGRSWTIPAGRMKNNKAHDVHLSASARDLLRSLPRRAGCDLVFTTNGKTPISGFSKAKASLDKLILEKRSSSANVDSVTPWRLHDFRRTGVSKLAAMGFDSIVADKLLAHQPARLKGVAAVYQRHTFWEERARALDAWAAHVVGASAGDNVVALRA